MRDIKPSGIFPEKHTVPSAQILKLTAFKTDSANLPQESPEYLPTYENSAAAYPSDKWTTEQVKLVVKKIVNR